MSLSSVREFQPQEDPFPTRRTPNLYIQSEDVSTQIWSSGKARSLSPYLGGPFPRKDGFCPCRKDTSSDFPGAGTHSRPDRWQRRHFVPDLSPRPMRLKTVKREETRTFQMAQTTGEAICATMSAEYFHHTRRGPCGTKLTIPSLRSKVARTGHDLGKFPEEHTRCPKPEED